MKTKKKVSRRSKDRFAALKPQYNLKTRQDLIDYDYVNQLNEEEKLWLSKFTEEFTNASLKKEDKKRKGKRRKLKNLHKTKKQKKSIYNSNNARNRDIYTKAKATGALFNIDDVFKNEEELHNHLQELNNYETEEN